MRVQVVSHVQLRYCVGKYMCISDIRNEMKISLNTTTSLLDEKVCLIKQRVSTQIRSTSG